MTHSTDLKILLLFQTCDFMMFWATFKYMQTSVPTNLTGTKTAGTMHSKLDKTHVAL